MVSVPISTGMVSSDASSSWSVLARQGHPAQRGHEALLRDRLEEVARAAHVEGGQRMLLVGRDEDDGRWMRELRHDAGQFEAVHPRHGDIEEDDVEVLVVRGGGARRWPS